MKGVEVDRKSPNTKTGITLRTIEREFTLSAKNEKKPSQYQILNMCKVSITIKHPSKPD